MKTPYGASVNNGFRLRHQNGSGQAYSSQRIDRMGRIIFAHSTGSALFCTMRVQRRAFFISKVKRLTLDCYEHGLLVRALYELWKEQPRERGQADALGDLILKVIDAPEKKRFWRW